MYEDERLEEEMPWAIMIIPGVGVVELEVELEGEALEELLSED